MTLTLTPLGESRLRALAAESGQAPEEVIEMLLEREKSAASQGTASGSRAPSAMSALFDEWDAEDETDDPEELRRRNQGWNETKANLASNRLTLRDARPLVKVEDAA